VEWSTANLLTSAAAQRLLGGAQLCKTLKRFKISFFPYLPLSVSFLFHLTYLPHAAVTVANSGQTGDRAKIFCFCLKNVF